MIKVFYFCCLILVFSSCSVEKRLYTKGWSVTWKNGLESQSSNQKRSYERPLQDKPFTRANETQSVNVSDEPLMENEEFITDEVVSSEVRLDTHSIVQHEIVQEEIIQNDRIMYVPPKFEPFGVAAMSAFGLSAISFTIVTLSAVTPLLLLSFLAALVAIVFGIISLRRWKNSRSGTYKAKWMTYVGLIGGIFGVAFYALTFILLAIAFG